MGPANTRALTFPPFTDQAFTATKFDTAADKAWFANALCRFIETDFQQTFWKRRLYSRLADCFGHIAHHDSHGFWLEFFADLRGKVAFLEEALSHPCYGQPDHTYCDVERAIQARLHACGTLATYRALRAAEIESAERALLDRLRTKYEGVAPTRPAGLPVLTPAGPPRRRHTETSAEQPSLL